MNVGHVEVRFAALAQDHRHQTAPGRDGWGKIRPAVTGDDVPFSRGQVVGKDIGVAELVGGVGEPLAARTPRWRGDNGMVSGDRLCAVAVVVGDVDFARVIGGLNLESHPGLGNPARLGERENHIIRKGMGQLTLICPGVGFGEQVVLLAV